MDTMVLDSEIVTAPPNTAEAWPVWRLVTEGVATLAEIERHWWLEDVFDANEALDVIDRQRKRGPRDWGPPL